MMRRKALLQMRRYAVFKAQNVQTGDFDVTFEIDGRFLHVHRSIVALSSPVLRAQMSEIWHPNRENTVKIETFSYEAIEMLLDFIYKDSCDILPENLITTIEMADFYNIPELLSYCDEMVQNWDISTAMALKFIQTAWQFSLEKLKTRCIETIFLHQDHTVALHDIPSDTNNLAEEIIKRLRSRVNPWLIYTFALNSAVFKVCQQEGETSIAYSVEIFKKSYHPLALLVDYSLLKNRRVLKYAGHLLSWTQMDQIWHLATPVIRFEVINSHGQSIIGRLWRFDPAFEVIEFDPYKFQSRSFAGWRTTLNAPPSTSIKIEKRDEQNCPHIWYLLYNKSGDLMIRKHANVKETDFLVCEMYGFSFEFDAETVFCFGEYGRD